MSDVLQNRWGTTGQLAIKKIEAKALAENRELSPAEEEVVSFIHEEDELRVRIDHAKAMGKEALAEANTHLDLLILGQPEAYLGALTMRREAVRELAESQLLVIPRQPQAVN